MRQQQQQQEQGQQRQRRQRRQQQRQWRMHIASSSVAFWKNLNWAQRSQHTHTHTKKNLQFFGQFSLCVCATVCVRMSVYVCVRILKVNFTTHKRKICCCRQFYLALVASQPTSLPALLGCRLPAAVVVVVFALFLAHSAFWFSVCACVCVCSANFTCACRVRCLFNGRCRRRCRRDGCLDRTHTLAKSSPICCSC